MRTGIRMFLGSCATKWTACFPASPKSSLSSPIPLSSRRVASLLRPSRTPSYSPDAHRKLPSAPRPPVGFSPRHTTPNKLRRVLTPHAPSFLASALASGVACHTCATLRAPSTIRSTVPTGLPRISANSAYECPRPREATATLVDPHPTYQHIADQRRSLRSTGRRFRVESAIRSRRLHHQSAALFLPAPTRYARSVPLSRAKPFGHCRC